MRPTNRTTWLFLTAFLGLAGLQSPGCSNEADNVARTGEDPALKGLCVQAADDGDPCTLEGCEGQPNAHVVTPGLSCGRDGALICTVTGECSGCTTPDQCGDGTWCLPWACDVDSICRQTPSPNGLPLQTQIPNDCKQMQCDGMGGDKTVNDDTDKPTTPCYDTVCVNGSPMDTPSVQGTECNVNGGNRCDGKGKCIECFLDSDCGAGLLCDPKSNRCFSCTNAIQDGDESDVNCGGDRCPACPQGNKCTVIQDCASSLFCADGICCNASCDGACESCNLPMNIGSCEFVEKYGQDPSYGAGLSCLAADNKACTGAGACKGALGAACNSSTECASGRCSMSKVCVKNTGDMCNQASECFSNMCTAGVCG